MNEKLGVSSKLSQEARFLGLVQDVSYSNFHLSQIEILKYFALFQCKYY
ncbi:hypothetical protein CAL7102_03009 [Dulcicalothrix desertica PCC 7102]|nr:hypothetical protein CAL7102_03009 [Dulcicalothrix desertica PCC 7102]